MNRRADIATRSVAATNPVLAGLAAWALPGLGHWLIGQRGRGLILFITIMLTYWSGVAIGGVAGTVDPKSSTLWFVAQMGIGPQAVGLYAVGGGAASQEGPITPWPDIEIALIYAGVAGLLNMLAVLDAVGRAVTDGAPAAPGPAPPRPRIGPT